MGIRYSNFGYQYFLSNYPTTWLRARDACREMGMNLTRIDNSEEQNWLHKTFRVRDPWIGVHDRDEEGNFVNVDGCPLRYTHWSYSKPDGRDGQDCVQLWVTRSWNDNQCSENYRFLCQKNDPNFRTRCGSCK